MATRKSPPAKARKRKTKRPRQARKDRFAEELLKLKGTVDPDIKLEF